MSAEPATPPVSQPTDTSGTTETTKKKAAPVGKPAVASTAQVAQTGAAAQDSTTPPAEESKAANAVPDAAAEPTVAKPTTATAAPKPVPAPAAPMPTPAPAALSHDASSVDAIFQAYAGIMGKSIVNTAAINQGITLLLRATELVVNSPHDDARDVYWQFQEVHKDDLMREGEALRGVRNLQGKQAALVSTTYSLIRHRVTRSGMAVDNQKAIATTSRQLIIWLDNKR